MGLQLVGLRSLSAVRLFFNVERASGERKYNRGREGKTRHSNLGRNHQRLRHHGDIHLTSGEESGLSHSDSLRKNASEHRSLSGEKREKNRNASLRKVKDDMHQANRRLQR